MHRCDTIDYTYHIGEERVCIVYAEVPLVVVAEFPHQRLVEDERCPRPLIGLDAVPLTRIAGRKPHEARIVYHNRRRARRTEDLNRNDLCECDCVWRG
jgi:hypothetical protein